VQELAFTLSNAMEYVKRAIAAGLKVDDFAPRLSFFFAAHNDLFEEVAKFRAARRMYARLMRERFKANDASAKMRFHTQTGGVTLQAQQPLNNVVRVTVQALAAVLGGTQSLHTHGYDEALALPTTEAATLALRTQQIVAHESGRRSPPIHLPGATTSSISPTSWRSARSSSSRKWTRWAARLPPSRRGSSRRRSAAAPTSCRCGSSPAP
jgi:methylmalonyl-CoA mutase cobalamin-binding domain/chain